MTLRYGLFQDLDTLGIGQADERILQYALQTADQLLVEHVVQELDVILAIVQSPLYAILDELLCQLHVVENIIEGHFRFNHPELGQVARCIGVFGTESRSERIDLSQSCSSQLTLQLSGNRQAGLFAEEIVIIDDRTLLILLQIIQIQGGHLEHLSGTLTVRSCNDRRMEIEEALVMEEFMDRVCHVVTDAEYRSKRIGTRTQVGNLP